MKNKSTILLIGIILLIIVIVIILYYRHKKLEMFANATLTNMKNSTMPYTMPYTVPSITFSQNQQTQQNQQNQQTQQNQPKKYCAINPVIVDNCISALQVINKYANSLLTSTISENDKYMLLNQIMFLSDPANYPNKLK